MAKIIQLEQHIADLIAAGEVVSKPASVVKELVENSIDAGAATITVEITSGGMTYIRVTDNGSGIEKSEVKTAFLRHATSKLRDAKGLESIKTLGFRGEALAAIAAVSRIEIITRTASADEGVCLTLEAGIPITEEPIGCPDGTTIIVRDLFFNTPARLKFMKTDRAEASAVSSVMIRCALSRPDISFRYIKDGKTEFHTPGDSKIDSCLYTLLGREFTLSLLPVDLSDADVSVKGYASLPDLSRGNRSNQYFFINGRTVRSVLLQSALEQAYRNMLMTGRYPACVLYIETGCSAVDVNVHPAKTEVRFVSDKQVFDGVYYAVSGALEKALSSTLGDIYRSNTKLHSISAPSQPAKLNNDAQTGGIQEELPGIRPAIAPGYSNAEKLYSQIPYTAYSRQTQTVAETPPLYAPYAPPFRLIGEALSTYIIVEKNDSVWFIDKHAAHERIHFDAYKSGKYEPMSEALISPIICRVGATGTDILMDNLSLLDTLGFVVDSFGQDAVAVRHIPADIHERDVESFLSELCTQIEHSDMPNSYSLVDIYKSLACKAAIKAGSKSTPAELESLAARVLSGEITHCPHGRPVAFELTKNTVEKNFKRV